MTKLTSKSILKKASGILAQEFAIPKDIAWAWVTLLLSQDEQKRDSEEKRYARIAEFEAWITELNLPTDPKNPASTAVSPESVKNFARNVFEWPHEYIFEEPVAAKHPDSKVTYSDTITKPILDAIKDAGGSDDRPQLIAILEGYAKEGKEPFANVTTEGIEWKGSNWSEGDKLNLLTIKTLNNRLANLKKKGLI
ncbi:hypothetical protein FD975_04810 [Polynucleobacter sp. AP-Jannik-300A-C4]|uniref:hypothetical protein n=1 Tax=Polynucleobacter sp. AP-Jannik-300A-C4 TaxID=2576928 RepID=UPI001BFE23B4|nr:hypothetical protein [Polynucleobacter sp. AP-Jannik-300A-C4]QWE23513.1 hypothetical protein FD975_04810 [Polynucleobacter sp. AP-Jannik-300A-C4]